VDPVGSGQGPVAGCCKYGDEPSGSDATELVHVLKMRNVIAFDWKDLKCLLLRILTINLRNVVSYAL
jgi:hypothetical protein